MNPGTGFRPGDVVADKYRVDRILGEGGMGVVVAGTHLQLEQRVALKFLRPALAAQPVLVQRFMREAKAAVKIHSDHVARVLDVGVHEGVPFMVMEYLEGSDIERLLVARGPLPPQEAVGYVLEAIEAVAEAHSLGIVHRDLKPANLFLANRTAGGTSVKVLDFGISKAPAGTEEAKLTVATAIMGSPTYMSPEQMVSAAGVDQRSDIWSIGIVLYEMLSGRPPFEAGSMPELVGAVLQRQHAPLAAVRPDVPPGLAAVVDRCLQKNAADRYANVVELARSLVVFGPPRGATSLEHIEQVLGHSRSEPPVAAAGVARSPTTPVEGATFSPSTSHRSSPGTCERRLALPLIGAAVVALAAAVLFGLQTQRGTPALSDVASATSARAEAVATSASAPVALDPLPAEPPAPSAAPSAGPPPPVASVPAASAPVPASPPRGPARTPAPPPSAAGSAHPASSCHTVTRFDADGNKHFKLECP
jgi:serine/threonine-protein kinase